MRWLLLAVLAASCASEERVPIQRPAVDDPPFDVPGAADQRGTVLLARHVGSTRPIDRLTARFTDAADPGPYALVAEEGPCRLHDREPSSCEPGCGERERCVAGDCHPIAVALDAGPVTVRGVAAEYELEPDAALVYRGDGGDDLHAADAAIEVTAAGQGDVPGFSGGVVAAAPLAAAIDPGAVVTIPSTEDLLVEWEEPAAASSTRIRLTLRTGEGADGLARQKLVCDTDDAGGLRVPASLLRQLPAMRSPGLDGQSGCDGPCRFTPSSLTRYRASEVAWSGGTVQIVSASEVLFWGVH